MLFSDEVSLSPQQKTQLIMSRLMKQKVTEETGNVPYWKLHGRKIEVPESMWKKPTPHNKGKSEIQRLIVET